MSNRVTCILKPDRENRYEAIIQLGGIRDDNGQRWSCTRQECVKLIRSGTDFYVEIGSHRVYLITGTSAQGTEYVRTNPDQDTQDNLLSLPECPQ